MLRPGSSSARVTTRPSPSPASSSAISWRRPHRRCPRSPSGRPKELYRSSRRKSGEALLEPVLGVDLVVEGGHLDVAAGSIEPDRLPEACAGLEPHDGVRRCRLLFQRGQQPAPEAQAPGTRRYPHALDLARPVGVKLDRT